MKNYNIILNMTQIREKISKKWENIKSYVGWEDYIAVFAIILGLVGYIHGSIPFIPGLTEFYYDIRSELVALGLTVLIIDNVNEMYRRRAEKERLILQMGSPDNGLAIEAVRQLKVKNWLYDGSLWRANLNSANLSKAILVKANMSFANLLKANLSEADLSRITLSGAYLSRANFSGAILELAHLSGANLSGAYFSKANLLRANLEKADLSNAELSGAYLKGAFITDEQLSTAHLSQDTTMPDGSKYDGRFEKTIGNYKKINTY